MLRLCVAASKAKAETPLVPEALGATILAGCLSLELRIKGQQPLFIPLLRFALCKIAAWQDKKSGPGAAFFVCSLITKMRQSSQSSQSSQPLQRAKSPSLRLEIPSQRFVPLRH